MESGDTVTSAIEPSDRHGHAAGNAGAAGVCAQLLLTEATDLVRLATVAERLALAQAGGTRARFVLLDAHDSAPPPPDTVSVELAAARARLVLAFAAAPQRLPAT